jgi:predicted transcriptional regulator
MKDVMSVPKSHLDDLNNRVTYLERVIRQLAEQVNMVETLEPPEGTPEWWEWSIREGEADMKAGRGTTLRTSEEIDQFFNAL